MGNLFGNIRPIEDIIPILLSFVIAITIHECMHAWTAHKIGDNTGKRLGRITLSPLAHFEPFGFIGIVLISIGSFFIGWGKPVPVQPGNFRGRWAAKRHQGMLLVAAAGPLSNVAQALIMAVPYQLFIRSGADGSAAGNFMFWFIWVNILLASFNAIPIPPLDGHKILMGLLPDFWRPVLAPLERYGFMILLLLFFFAGGLGASLVGGMIYPIQNALFKLVHFGLA